MYIGGAEGGREEAGGRGEGERRGEGGHVETAPATEKKASTQEDRGRGGTQLLPAALPPHPDSGWGNGCGFAGCSTSFCICIRMIFVYSHVQCLVQCPDAHA